MKKKDIKKGVLIWWTANRSSSSWDCPGVILNVGEHRYTVRTFDDFEESNPHFSGGDAGKAHEEMRIATKKEVREYVEDRKEEIKEDFRKSEREHRKHLREIDRKLEEAFIL